MSFRRTTPDLSTEWSSRAVEVGSRRLSTRNTEPSGFRARRMLSQNSSNRPTGTWDSQNETNTRSNPVGGVHEKMSALQYSTFPVRSRSRLIESISGAASVARTRELRAARRCVQRPVPQARAPVPLSLQSRARAHVPAWQFLETTQCGTQVPYRTVPALETTDRIPGLLRGNNSVALRLNLEIPRLLLCHK